MSKVGDGGPAFPLKRDPELAPLGGATIQVMGAVVSKWIDRDQAGMSLRDYFAGQALVALGDHKAVIARGIPWLSEHAYMVADAMLKARQA